MTEYIFGDSDLAARRLKILADTFAQSSRDFVTCAGKSALALAADLGCGPGHTTHMLADALQCRQTVGLDNSEYFVALAQKTATNNVTFRHHDVTATPFPVGPCDLIYSRFLLTHQPCPQKLLAKWSSQLRTHGRVLLEEVDSIRTNVSAFTQYLQIVERMLAHAGHDLYVGRTLNAIHTVDLFSRLQSRLARVSVTTQVAARMFSMNIQTWKDNAFVRQNYSAASIRQLKEALLRLADKPGSDKGIEWNLRQLLYQREN